MSPSDLKLISMKFPTVTLALLDAAAAERGVNRTVALLQGVEMWLGGSAPEKIVERAAPVAVIDPAYVAWVDAGRPSEAPPPVDPEYLAWVAAGKPAALKALSERAAVAREAVAAKGLKVGTYDDIVRSREASNELWRRLKPGKT